LPNLPKLIQQKLKLPNSTYAPVYRIMPDNSSYHEELGFFPSLATLPRPMIHLLEIRLNSGANDDWPFTIPAFASLQTLRLESPMTCLVGENGSGKSTLLESIAQGIGAIAVGAHDIERDQSLNHLQPLVARLKFGWAHRTRRGFFGRAEDFFPFTHRLQRLKAELLEQAQSYERDLLENEGENLLRDEGIKRARGVAMGQIAELNRRYGENLDANSHGESFLKLFQSRFVPGGLYLLDEPEAALSPLRQLAFVSLLKEMCAQECQFIIATHSPILMAFPDAQLLHFGSGPIAPIAYDEVEHVSLLRNFLHDPQAFVRRL